ncbi:MAG: N-acetylmuramoyl-L-alanine amidase, partial [Ignavibacteriaceae bacterium]|nr:N-acetylmuramoyl-L-alanine amidase [Ignavibacteriaceae bacterium]
MKVYKKIKLLVFLGSVLFLFQVPKLNAQPVTGLSGWDIYVDPGHSQFENMGIYGYSEAEKNVRVALNLRQMLLDWTDIDTVYLSREDDIEYVSLTQRSTEANSLGAKWFHSLHSDASSMGSSANSTLLLWGQYLDWTEKIPNGGKAMSDIMIGLLTSGMRTYTVRGSIGDCTFYQYANPTSCPYLSVNRNTLMPSELSEAGFHTNPIQNVLNMNAEQKKLQAYTFYWSILKHHSISRPYVGIVTGIISDLDSGVKLNGATAEIEGKSYTTDTYESLFYKYTTDPELLRNGFYFIENVSAGTHQLIAYAPGYDTLTVDVTPKDTFFTFVDLKLISKTPPKVLSTVPAEGDSLYPGYDNLVINFSRPMDKALVESNISYNPPATATYTWSNS